MANQNPRLNPDNQVQTEKTSVPTETTPMQSPEPQQSQVQPETTQPQPQKSKKEIAKEKKELERAAKKLAKPSIVETEEKDEYTEPELKVPSKVGKHFTDNLADPDAEKMTVGQVIAHMATVNNVPREFNRLRNNGLIADEETTRNALRNKGFSL